MLDIVTQILIQSYVKSFALSPRIFLVQPFGWNYFMLPANFETDWYSYEDEILFRKYQ